MVAAFTWRNVLLLNNLELLCTRPAGENGWVERKKNHGKHQTSDILREDSVRLGVSDFNREACFNEESAPHESPP